jgi:hypothetical protein
MVFNKKFEHGKEREVLVTTKLEKKERKEYHFVKRFPDFVRSSLWQEQYEIRMNKAKIWIRKVLKW